MLLLSFSLFFLSFLKFSTSMDQGDMILHIISHSHDDPGWYSIILQLKTKETLLLVIVVGCGHSRNITKKPGMAIAPLTRSWKTTLTPWGPTQTGNSTKWRCPFLTISTKEPTTQRGKASRASFHQANWHLSMEDTSWMTRHALITKTLSTKWHSGTKYSSRTSTTSQKMLGISHLGSWLTWKEKQWVEWALLYN